MEEKLGILKVVWKGFNYSNYWLKVMVEVGEISEAEAGWLIWNK
jgi:hypothetical protein